MKYIITTIIGFVFIILPYGGILVTLLGLILIIQSLFRLKKNSIYFQENSYENTSLDSSLFCPFCKAQIISRKFTSCTSCGKDLPESFLLEESMRKKLSLINEQAERDLKKAVEANLNERNKYHSNNTEGTESLF